MRSISFIIPGPPVGKARPRVVRAKSGISLTYTPDKTVAYEELTRIRYKAAAQGFRFPDDSQLCIQITACFPIPASKSKRAKAGMLEGSLKPTKKPDCDNIVKIICDALNGLHTKTMRRLYWRRLQRNTQTIDRPLLESGRYKKAALIRRQEITWLGRCQSNFQPDGAYASCEIQIFALLMALCWTWMRIDQI